MNPSTAAIFCFVIGGVLVLISGTNLTFAKKQGADHQTSQVILGMSGLAVLAIGLVLAIVD